MDNRKVITKQIKDYVLNECKMDKVGIASMDRFNSSPEGFHPTDFLPGCKSVICFAIRVPEGAAQATFRAFEDGNFSAHGIYGAFGYVGAPNYWLLFGAYKTSKFVERMTGEVAMPQTAGPTHGEKLMSMRHCAVASGIAQFGWNSIALTAEFGPRNRFGVVLTTADLEPDPIDDGPRLCDPTKCHICEKMCPTGAIPPYAKGQERQFEMGGVKMSYSGINWNNCRVACHGMRAAYNNTGGDLTDITLRHPRFSDVFYGMTYYENHPNDNFFQHDPTWKCGNCLTYCPVGNWKEAFYDTGISLVDTQQFIDKD